MQGIAVLLGLTALAGLLIGLALRNRPSQARRAHRRKPDLPAAACMRSTSKPPWVRQEGIRLKALIPENGCRKIADTFNHLHRRTCGMTLGKNYIAGVVRDGKLEIVRRRRELKHRLPRRLPSNLIWATDLAEVRDATVASRTVFGLLDH